MGKIFKCMVLFLLLALLSACTANIYGVPKETWQTMSQADRMEAMRLYQQRRTAEANARAAREQRLHAQQAARRARLEAELAERQAYAEAIYSGRSGRYGDLLQVTIFDGRMRIHGHHRHYSRVSFTIAAGDVKKIPVVIAEGPYQNKTLDLYASFYGGQLWLDTDAWGGQTDHAIHLADNEGWRQRRAYKGLRSRGSLYMDGISVEIKAIPLPGQNRPVAVHPPVVVRERVVVREKVVKTPVTKVIVKETPTKVVVVKQQPKKIVVVKQQPKKIVVVKQQPKKIVVVKQQPKKIVVVKQQPKKIVVVKHRPKEHPTRKNHNWTKVRLTVKSGDLKFKGRVVVLFPVVLNLKVGDVKALVVKGKRGGKVRFWVRCKKDQVVFSPSKKFDRNLRHISRESVGQDEGEFEFPLGENGKRGRLLMKIAPIS